MPEILGGLSNGFSSNFEIGLTCLDFASSAHAPVVERDGDERVFMIGLFVALVFNILLKGVSMHVKGFPGE